MPNVRIYNSLSTKIVVGVTGVTGVIGAGGRGNLTLLLIDTYSNISAMTTAVKRRFPSLRYTVLLGNEIEEMCDKRGEFYVPENLDEGDDQLGQYDARCLRVLSIEY